MGNQANRGGAARISKWLGSGKKDCVNGKGLDAAFNGPSGLALHPDGTRLFISEMQNCCIRVVDLTTGSSSLRSARS